MKIALVIFDWAGTLLDFGCCAPLVAFLEAFELVNLPISEAIARKPMGAHKRDHVREILQYPEIVERVRIELGRAADESLTSEIYDFFCQRLPIVLPRYAEPIPGALETVAWLRDHKIAVGSTTGYTRPMMNVLESVTRSIGIDRDSIVCSDEVPQSRPAPWGCFRMAEKFKIYPMSHCLKIGDTPADIAEGLNAGMASIGVCETGNEVGLSRDSWIALSPDEQDQRRNIANLRMQAAGAQAIIAGVHELPAWIERQRASTL